MASKNNDLWLKRFEEYKTFVFEQGKFPSALAKNENEAKIGSWLRNQIIAYHRSFLPQERLDLLNSFNPAWCGDRAAKQKENKQLFIRSNWKRKVPEGHTPIDVALCDEELYHCLKNGIYSCELFFDACLPRTNSIETELKVFNSLFPKLDYRYTKLLSATLANRKNLFSFALYLSENSLYKSPDDMRDKIDAVLCSLSLREKSVVELRFGLADGNLYRLEDVALKFNVTRERIRQTEAEALRKLRHSDRARALMMGFTVYKKKHSPLSEQISDAEIRSSGALNSCDAPERDR